MPDGVDSSRFRCVKSLICFGSRVVVENDGVVSSELVGAERRYAELHLRVVRLRRAPPQAGRLKSQPIVRSALM